MEKSRSRGEQVRRETETSRKRVGQSRVEKRRKEKLEIGGRGEKKHNNYDIIYNCFHARYTTC